MDDYSSPDTFLESIRAEADAEAAGDRLGQIVSGSLSAGLEMRLDRGQSLDDLAVGRYVTIRAGGRIFFGMITDIALEAGFSSSQYFATVFRRLVGSRPHEYRIRGRS